MRFLTAGSRALLVELDPGSDAKPRLHSKADTPGAAPDPEPAHLYRVLAGTPPLGAVEFVPAARTVLVRYDPAHTTAAQLADRIRAAARGVVRAEPDVSAADAAAVLEIPVRYDGEDLDEVARMTGLSPADVVARHSAALYTVAFCGFAPGFGYLTGLDAALRLPRRDEPRTRVPAGSVAIADIYTAVYPHPSPGGWRLLGRTETAVWDQERQPPALLVPGTRVRFRRLDGR